MLKKDFQTNLTGNIWLIQEAAIYLKKTVGLPGSINIPWTEFIDANGSVADPNQVKQILKQRGIREENPEIIFYSEDGVSSGYATFAVTEASFKARNYDGGLNEWLAMRSANAKNR